MSHGKTVCKCGVVLFQCRCINHNETVVSNLPCNHTKPTDMQPLDHIDDKDVANAPSVTNSDKDE